MDWIIGARQCGKTTKMLDWLAGEPEGVLVCINENEVARLREKVKRDRLNINPERIVSVRTVTGGGIRGMRIHTLGVDNLDMMLSQLFGERVQIATMDTGHNYTVIDQPNGTKGFAAMSLYAALESARSANARKL